MKGRALSRKPWNRLAIALVTAILGSCSPSTAPLIEERHTLDIGADRPVELTLRLQRAHRGHGPRFIDGARGALQRFQEWLGPLPLDSITILDAPPGTSAGEPSIVSVASPSRILEPLRARSIETNLVGALSDYYWSQAIDTTALEGSGLAAALRLYTQTRAVDEAYGGNRFHEERFFGDLVPYVIRSVPMAGVDNATAARRQTLALMTLERYLGWPVLQGGLRQFVERYRSTRPTPQDFFSTISEVAGRDLSWFFDEAFASDRVFDYGIEGLSSVPHPQTPGLFVTSVIVRRFGDATFSGTSRTPSGPFESGRGVEVKVIFDGGEAVREHWDGRDATKAFSYESSKPASFAHVDPDHILRLDVDQLNNVRVLEPTPAPAIARWSLAWAAWLQNAMLTYGPML